MSARCLCQDWARHCRNNLLNANILLHCIDSMVERNHNMDDFDYGNSLGDYGQSAPEELSQEDIDLIKRLNKEHAESESDLAVALRKLQAMKNPELPPIAFKNIRLRRNDAVAWKMCVHRLVDTGLMSQGEFVQNLISHGLRSLMDATHGNEMFALATIAALPSGLAGNAARTGLLKKGLAQYRKREEEIYAKEASSEPSVEVCKDAVKSVEKRDADHEQ